MEFSMRDYSNKMRTINAFECWPFELKEDVTQEKINSMLPPMTNPNNSSRFVSQNDVSRRQSPQHSDQRNSNKIIPDANDVASASREKLLSRSKLRRRSIAEIFDRKKNDEKPQPMPAAPNYPLAPPPPPPQPTKDLHLPSSSPFQIGNLLNVIVLEDNEEEDDQMVSKFRRSKRLEALRSEPELQNKILTMASETNVACDREGETENEVDVKVKEFIASKEDAAKVKLQNSVINSPGEIAVHNFLKSCAKQKILNHLAKKSKPGPDEGTANLKVNTNDENIAENMHKRKDVCPIENTPGEAAVQNILKSCSKQEKSKQPVKKCKSLSKVSFSDDNLIQFDKGDTTKVHFSPDVELSRPLSAFQEEGINSINTEVVKSESSQPSAADRDASSRTYKAPNEDMIGKSCSLLEEEKKGVTNYNMEHNFNGLSLNPSGKLIKFGSSGKVEMKHQGGSQLQISTANMIQPVKVHSNETLQNQSLGVSGSAISNIPEHIIARTNPKGIISRPKLRNSKMNDRKRIHRGTSSASGIPFSSPPRTSRMFSPAHQGPTWSHDFPNTNVCPVQVSQPTHIPTTHVPNPPSATNRNITKAAAKVTHIPVTRAFSNSRTRPNKFPEVEQQENLTQMNVDQDSSATDSDRDLQGNTREVDSLDPNGMPKHSENVDQDSSATDSDRDFEDQKKLTKPSKQSEWKEESKS